MSCSGKKINITVWNENVHDKEERVKAIYPEGIHGAVKSALDEDNTFKVTIATLDMPEHGLSDEVLNNTDVLFWWGHVAHGKLMTRWLSVYGSASSAVWASSGCIPPITRRYLSV